MKNDTIDTIHYYTELPTLLISLGYDIFEGAATNTEPWALILMGK